jgi:hypothetical protein
MTTLRAALVCLLLCLASGACTSRAARCDGSLQPINAPGPAARPVSDATTRPGTDGP